eukprot:Skav227198  [mRNA]  locus=scaffold2048:212726:215305:- [translate_table: standard]
MLTTRSPCAPSNVKHCQRDNCELDHFMSGLLIESDAETGLLLGWLCRKVSMMRTGRRVATPFLQAESHDKVLEDVSMQEPSLSEQLQHGAQCQRHQRDPVKQLRCKQPLGQLSGGLALFAGTKL